MNALLHPKPKDSSWIWKCICKCLEFIRNHCIWEVKKGDDISAFNDNWIEQASDPLCLAYPNPNLKVSDFLIAETKQLNTWMI